MARLGAELPDQAVVLGLELVEFDCHFDPVVAKVGDKSIQDGARQAQAVEGDRAGTPTHNVDDERATPRCDRTYCRATHRRPPTQTSYQRAEQCRRYEQRGPPDDVELHHAEPT